MTNLKENGWKLDDNIQVAATLFKGSMYLHIRVWKESKPTKQGVSLNFLEWLHLMSFLTFDVEAEIGIIVLKEMFCQNVNLAVKEKCEGCKHQWASQKDHDCLMKGWDIANSVLDDVFKDVDYLEFMAALGKVAQKKKVAVKRPYETFHILKLCKEKELKEDILSSYMDQ